MAAVKHLFAILLLLTAAVHPLVHLGDAMNDCPCVHGAVVEVIRPHVDPAVIAARTYARPASAHVEAGVPLDVPSRAPPVA